MLYNTDLSAVSSSSGTLLWLASTTAGSRFATAVPLLQITAAGSPLGFARLNPRAQNPRLRSSMAMVSCERGWLAAASASGDEREPAKQQQL
jgi:hypothetical protein